MGGVWDSAASVVAGLALTLRLCARCDGQQITRADNTAVASVGGAHAASISARGADDPVGWVPVVSVESCDDTAARIADAGGSSAPVNGAAFHTLLGRDPDGGAFQVSEMPEELHQPLPQAQPVPGMANWGDILTDDGRESALTAFYLYAIALHTPPGLLRATSCRLTAAFAHCTSGLRWAGSRRLRPSPCPRLQVVASTSR